MEKRLEACEERVKPLPDAKTTWIPSTLVRLMDRECLTHVRKSAASEDFDKMLAAVEELYSINRSVNQQGSLRTMCEDDQEEREDEDENENEDDEAERFDRWARDTSTTKDELLAPEHDLDRPAVKP